MEQLILMSYLNTFTFPLLLLSRTPAFFCHSKFQLAFPLCPNFSTSPKSSIPLPRQGLFVWGFFQTVISVAYWKKSNLTVLVHTSYESLRAPYVFHVLLPFRVHINNLSILKNFPPDTSWESSDNV